MGSKNVYKKGKIKLISRNKKKEKEKVWKN